MNKFIKEMLSDSGSISTVRVMSLFSLLTGAAIAMYGIAKGAELGGIAQVCTVFVGGAFAGKVSQKYMEKK